MAKNQSVSLPHCQQDPSVDGRKSCATNGNQISDTVNMEEPHKCGRNGRICVLSRRSSGQKITWNGIFGAAEKKIKMASCLSSRVAMFEKMSVRCHFFSAPRFLKAVKRRWGMKTSWVYCEICIWPHGVDPAMPHTHLHSSHKFCLAGTQTTSYNMTIQTIHGKM